MHRITSQVSIVLIFATFVVFQAGAIGQTVDDAVRMTTPLAPWTIAIDGKPLYLGRANVKPGDERSAYFLMSDDVSNMSVSIYIEPAEKCTTSDACRDMVLKIGNPAWGDFQDLAKGKIGEFSYFEFYRPVAMGEPVKMLDMYAEFVSDGYWVDLHISKVDYKKTDHALFEDYVRSLKFLPKKDAAAPLLNGVVEKNARDWLVLFDAGKCAETYAALTSISKAAVTENTWTGYCRSLRTGIGKVRSRKLIGAALLKSLPGKPGVAVGTLHYQLAADAGNVEFVSVTMEKDGRWTVSNYKAQ